MEPNTPIDPALLVEYEKAQDSAQHHDTLVWTVVSFIFSGMLVLLGFVVSSLDKPQLKDVLYAVSGLGVLVTLAAILIALQFNSIKRFKYERCREIEKLWGVRQHQDVPYRARSQRIGLLIISFVFFAVWVIVICHVWRLPWP